MLVCILRHCPLSIMKVREAVWTEMRYVVEDTVKGVTETIGVIAANKVSASRSPTTSVSRRAAGHTYNEQGYAPDHVQFMAIP